MAPPAADVVIDDEHLGVLGHHDPVGVAVLVDLVPVQNEDLGAEATPVPHHLLQLLPVVTELGGVGEDRDAVGGSCVVPHPSHRDALAADPAEVGAAVTHTVTELPLRLWYVVRVDASEIIWR